MSDQNSDKTKIKSNKISTAGPVDKTRLAPAKTVIKPRPQNDQTRIAPSKSSEITNPQSANVNATLPEQHPENQSEAGDRTRIALKPEQRTVIRNDTNRNTSQVSDNVEKTQENYKDGPSDYLPLEPADIESMGDHGVLKKRFILESVLGAGGMGIVYKAKDLLKVEAQDRDPYVAIKVLGEEFKSHPEAFISLQRESRKSQRIAHPNIVNVHDFDRDGDTVFMTMEFMDGSPLDELIRRYKSTGLPTEDALEIIKGMCAALSHAHAEKIIHSDFKPGNVFVTKKGVAKVFDFGIARAVSKVEHLDDNPEDKTVFDAGNLGALTPAYASLEMLEGKEPDVRDDIFALGCVAYELFTAEHPYKKIPADEAAKQGIKPKKITNITRSQWRAIEKAIAFKREDRIESVDKFLEELIPKAKSSNMLATVFALLLSVAITVYFVFFQQKPEENTFSEFDIRNELELKIRIDYLKENLDTLIANPEFTNSWQDSSWKDVTDLVTLTQGEAPWVDERKLQLYKLYLIEIATEIKSSKFSSAKKLIENAKRYSADISQLESHSADITRAIELQKSRQAANLEKERIRNLKQANKQKQALLAQQKKNKLKQQNKAMVVEDTKTFNLALENVDDQLKCVNRLNMRNIETAVKKLREVDITRYKGLEDKIVSSLAKCIVHTGKAFPERALEAKKHSLRIFKLNPMLVGISIKARDSCDKSLAGLGARGKRALCRDKIKGIGTGPELVVIPGSSKLKLFAIGKYEVSVEELNAFCISSSYCNPLSASDEKIPATGINVKTVKKYLSWLTKDTGKKYRLPTKDEWIYAAKSRRKKLDANRNCKLSTRGIQKGEGLVRNSIGQQNSWGLVNYVGNAQEWVYDKGRKLKAVGGSYEQSMENCNITTIISHNGAADKKTGFRVVREVETNS